MIKHKKESLGKHLLLTTAMIAGLATVGLAQSRPIAKTTVKTVSVESLQGTKSAKKSPATARPNSKVTVVKVGDPASLAQGTVSYQVAEVAPNASKQTPKKDAVKGSRTVSRDLNAVELKRPARIKE